MNSDYITFDQAKMKYPDEWVLFGDPDMINTSVLGGIVVYHSKDKKEVCYIGKDKIGNFKTVTIAFTGEIFETNKEGISNSKRVIITVPKLYHCFPSVYPFMIGYRKLCIIKFILQTKTNYK